MDAGASPGQPIAAGSSNPAASASPGQPIAAGSSNPAARLL